MIGIYEIICVSNGKRYIGQSLNIESRIKDHKRDLIQGIHRNPYLQSAFIKYGMTGFDFNVLHECQPNDLDEQEIKFIELYKTTIRSYGYNLMTGGSINTRHSEETRKKLSDIFKGRKHTAETIQKIRASLLGRPVSDFTRSKISHSLKNHSTTKETREKIGNALRGRSPSLETRKKLSASRLGKKRPPMSEEQKTKISKAHKGVKEKPRSEEWRKKISEHKKKYWKEWRANAAAIRGERPEELTAQ